ncbi:MAG: acetyl-CoA carboxylase carboxyltransferase subunit alpha [Aestuariivita sp.]|nr:acetyl-CoA carboxylase carboxyltransferase subunit alpha [Aestuariivita sp.]
MVNFLDFEKSLAEIEGKAEELRALAREDRTMDVEAEAKGLDEKAKKILEDLFANLTAWQKCQVARHVERPRCSDYIDELFSDYVALAGDRSHADDSAIMGGLARFDERPVVVLGHEKGSDTKSRIEHNFGMARPEGYRKAVRLMRLADRFGLPVITLVDTPGAYPGIGAEQRGQSEAIARSTETCLQIRVPMISVVIGEGGSGGAIAIAAVNRIAMLEHSVFSVISPEGCASILWKDAEKMREAASALRLTAQDLKQFDIIDRVISEPLGGAHRDKVATLNSVGTAIREMMAEIRELSPDELLKERRRKFVNLGINGIFFRDELS